MLALMTANSQTPLHLAALKGNLDIVKLLFESGADCNICDGNESNTFGHGI
jgi:ankyrin repeat protein